MHKKLKTLLFNTGKLQNGWKKTNVF